MRDHRKITPKNAIEAKRLFIPPLVDKFKDFIPKRCSVIMRTINKDQKQVTEINAFQNTSNINETQF